MPAFRFAAGEKQLCQRLERTASFGSIQTEQNRRVAFRTKHTQVPSLLSRFWKSGKLHKHTVLGDRAILNVRQDDFSGLENHFHLFCRPRQLQRLVRPQTWTSTTRGAWSASGRPSTASRVRQYYFAQTSSLRIDTLSRAWLHLSYSEYPRVITESGV